MTEEKKKTTSSHFFTVSACVPVFCTHTFIKSISCGQSHLYSMYFFFFLSRFHPHCTRAIFQMNRGCFSVRHENAFESDIISKSLLFFRLSHLVRNIFPANPIKHFIRWPNGIGGQHMNWFRGEQTNQNAAKCKKSMNETNQQVHTFPFARIYLMRKSWAALPRFFFRLARFLCAFIFNEHLFLFVSIMCTIKAYRTHAYDIIAFPIAFSKSALISLFVRITFRSILHSKYFCFMTISCICLAFVLFFHTMHRPMRHRFNG